MLWPFVLCPALFYRSSCHAGGCGALYNLMSLVQVNPKQYTSPVLFSRSWRVRRKCVIQYPLTVQSLNSVENKVSIPETLFFLDRLS